MATRISIKELQKLIEEQKTQALYGTTHVWADSTTQAQITSITQKLSSICENPALFVNHAYSASTNQAAMAREMASCFPKILLVALCNTSAPKAVEWVDQQFASAQSKIPFADLKMVDTNNISPEESQYIDHFNPPGNPTILAFKMGHLIDKFIPEVQTLDDNIAQQLEERNREMAEKAKTTVQITQADIDAELHRGIDKGRDDYEQRQREKAAAEAQKEAIEKRKERLRVKARIEEMKKQRRDRY